MSPLNFLAQDETGPGDIIFICVFLLIVVLGAAYAVIWLRKRLWSQDDSDAPVAGFTLGDLKQLHKQGKITDQEFQSAKDKVVAAAQAAAQRQATKQTPKQSPPKAR